MSSAWCAPAAVGVPGAPACTKVCGVLCARLLPMLWIQTADTAALPIGDLLICEDGGAPGST
jgi:hypothetical protein